MIEANVLPLSQTVQNNNDTLSIRIVVEKMSFQGLSEDAHENYFRHIARNSKKSKKNRTKQSPQNTPTGAINKPPPSIENKAIVEVLAITQLAHGGLQGQRSLGHVTFLLHQKGLQLYVS